LGIDATNVAVVPTPDSCAKEGYAELEAQLRALKEEHEALKEATLLEKEERLSKDSELTREVKLLKEQVKVLLGQPAKKKQEAKSDKQHFKDATRPLVLELIKANNLTESKKFDKKVIEDMKWFETAMRDDLTCVIWEVRDELDKEWEEFRGCIVTFLDSTTNLPEQGRAYVPRDDTTFGAKPARLSVRDLIAKYRELSRPTKYSRHDEMVLDREGYRIHPINF